MLSPPSILEIVFFFIDFWYNLGEPVNLQQWTRFIVFLRSSNSRIFAQYGTSECGGALGCQLQNIDDTVLSIGHPFPGVQCLLINEQGQIIRSTDNLDEIGQIYIGGK
jgi:acyl-coenzyme A synthetase/AMP-(fatty) acid ligase